VEEPAVQFVSTLVVVAALYQLVDRVCELALDPFLFVHASVQKHTHSGFQLFRPRAWLIGLGGADRLDSSVRRVLLDFQVLAQHSIERQFRGHVVVKELGSVHVVFVVSHVDEIALQTYRIHLVNVLGRPHETRLCGFVEHAFHVIDTFVVGFPLSLHPNNLFDSTALQLNDGWGSWSSDLARNNQVFRVLGSVNVVHDFGVAELAFVLVVVGLHFSVIRCWLIFIKLVEI